MSVVTDLQTLITNANSTLTDLNNLIDELEEQYPATWCHTFDFTASDGGWSAADGFSVNRTSAGWEGGDPSNADRVHIKRTWSPAVQLTSVTVNLNGSFDSDVYLFICEGETGIPGSAQVHANPPSASNTKELNGQYTSIALGCERGGANTTAWGTITSVILRGTGADPFGASNCT